MLFHNVNGHNLCCDSCGQNHGVDSVRIDQLVWKANNENVNIAHLEFSPWVFVANQYYPSEVVVDDGTYYEGNPAA